MRYKGVLLAAGNSQRFDGIKQLAIVNEGGARAMLAHTYSAMAASDVANCAIALRDTQKSAFANVLPQDTDVICCPDAQLGMGHTIANVVATLADDISHLLISLADQVALTHEHFNRLVSASNKAPNNIICASTEAGVSVPAIFPRHFFPSLSTLQGDKGAKKVILETLANQARHVSLIAMPEAQIDIDSREDLRRWQQQSFNRVNKHDNKVTTINFDRQPNMEKQHD